MATVTIEDSEFFLARRKEKEVSRLADQARVKAGEDPRKITWENSIFSPEFFKDSEVTNLRETVGL